MPYDTLLFLFVAVALTYLALAGVVLRRELAEVREDRMKDQPPHRTTNGMTNEWTREQLWKHLRKIHPSRQTEHGPLDSTEYRELEEQVQFHFYRLLPRAETERESTG